MRIYCGGELSAKTGRNAANICLFTSVYPFTVAGFSRNTFCRRPRAVLCFVRDTSPRTTSRAAETIFRLQFIPPVAGRNHPRRARRQGRVRRAADRRRQVALLPTARARAARTHRRRLAAHRADEGPGGRAASRRCRGDVSEFFARRRRIPSAAARVTQRRISPALCRAGAADAVWLSRRFEKMEREPVRD